MRIEPSFPLVHRRRHRDHLIDGPNELVFSRVHRLFDFSVRILVVDVVYAEVVRDVTKGVLEIRMPDVQHDSMAPATTQCRSGPSHPCTEEHVAKDAWAIYHGHQGRAVAY